ncbi:helix-turn-helix domain-containing protein [Streptomyces olivaceus]|uniref:helix-turn-helix domain-containing protein n=1 Tax=Streptomyces olivaceus TaxID=47716 RepID=UPI0036930E74
MSDLKVFRVIGRQATETPGASVSVERDLQTLIEANMEVMLGIRFPGPSTAPVVTGAGSTRWVWSLSRYNGEDLCAGCIRDNRQEERTARSIPMGIWQLPDVRQALINREFGQMCQLIRQHGGIRQDMAVLTGLSQAFLSMLESGARKLTNIDKIIQLLDGLQAPPELTVPTLRPGIHHELRGSASTALSRR